MLAVSTMPTTIPRTIAATVISRYDGTGGSEREAGLGSAPTEALASWALIEAPCGRPQVCHEVPNGSAVVERGEAHSCEGAVPGQLAGVCARRTGDHHE